MVTPEKLAQIGTESGHQQAVFCWIRLNQNTYPELMKAFHIPNGGARGSNERERMIRGAKLKAEGVKEGVSDIFQPVPRGGYCGMFLEMKKPGQKVREGSEQYNFLKQTLQDGYFSVWCDNWKDGVKLLVKYTYDVNIEL